jgi:hypothetical protein
MSEVKSYILVPGKDEYEHLFGGNEWDMESCAICKGDVHQIVTLDLQDPRLAPFRNPMAGMTPMVSCLNCSASWWTQAYIIKNNQIQWAYQDVEERDFMVEEDWVEAPLPVVPMKLEEYDDSNEEKFWEEFGEKFICKVGGEPIWAEDPVDLKCPNCNRQMQFVGMIGGEKPENHKRIIPNVSFKLGTNVYYYAVCPECGEITVDCQERKF